MDIAAIDGVPVNASNFDAREMAMSLQDLDPAIRPDEIGTPWAINGPGYFTDGEHQNHLHVGFDHEISPDFKPPGDVAAPADAVTQRRHAGRAGARSAKAADVGHESLSFMAAVEPRQRGGGAVDAAAELAAGGNGGGAGAKALAALAEAKKYLGTPYQWGGVDPADPLRLLRPRAMVVRARRDLDPARDRPADPRRERHAGRPQTTCSRATSSSSATRAATSITSACRSAATSSSMRRTPATW